MQLLSNLTRRLRSAATWIGHILAQAVACAKVVERCAKGGAGTGNPASELTRNFGFRGADAHVQTARLKAAAHVTCMLPAPAAPALSVREFGVIFPHNLVVSANHWMPSGGDYDRARAYICAFSNKRRRVDKGADKLHRCRRAL
ncbi:hypothetical protein NOVOSPHI9U_260022 [Novosphingobium sp. 9U]|nr:hypothetical protein NOVOSPHI9U_260022 [Novosphingobium sp. 9U]